MQLVGIFCIRYDRIEEHLQVFDARNTLLVPFPFRATFYGIVDAIPNDFAKRTKPPDQTLDNYRTIVTKYRGTM